MQSVIANLPKENVMKSENLIPFAFNGSPITIIMHNNEPWFIANEICEALGYLNSRKAVADHLDDDERMTVAKCDGQLFNELMTVTNRYSHSGKRGGAQFLTLISESGMYSLVLRSHKPEAKKFSKWVTREVLPSIRKTGSYSTNPELQLSKEDLNRIHGLCAHFRVLDGWWFQYGDTIRKLNRRMAASLHDHFADGAWFVGTLVKKYNLDVSSLEYVRNFPFTAEFYDQHQYFLANKHN